MERRERVIGIIMMVVVLLPWTVQGALIRVPEDAPTIQAGIDQAVDGDSIRLSDHIFTGAGNRDVSFRGKRLAVFSQSGPENCTIDCENVGRAFIFNRDDSQGQTIQGITIINGHADEGGAVLCDFNSGAPEFIGMVFRENNASINGGAVFLDLLAHASFSDCRFESNYAESEGGALFCDQNATVGLIGCRFSGNRSSVGGALVSPVFTEFSLQDCTFEFNTAVACGGAVFVPNHSVISIDRCLFESNSAADGAALRLDYDTDVSIQGCTFRSNAADESGGAIQATSQALSITSSVIELNTARYGAGIRMHVAQSTVHRCQFSENVAELDGGGIYYEVAASGGIERIIVTDSSFRENSASSGGGMKMINGNLNLRASEFNSNHSLVSGGGISTSRTNGSISDCIMQNNESVQGGGARCSSGDISVTGCHFKGNTASGGDGGGMYAHDISQPMIACSFESNTADSGGGLRWEGDSGLIDCIFSRNHAQNSGAGSYSSCGLYERCSWNQNDAQEDGGGLCQTRNYSVTFIGCAFIGNSSAGGGAISSWESSSWDHRDHSFIGCTFSGNRSNSSEAIIHWGQNASGQAANSLFFDNEPEIFVSTDVYTHFCAIPPRYAGIGNIHSDPGMIGGEPFDPRLRSDSPCIDAGRSGYEIPVDLDGNPRLQGGAMDIGAYESPYRPLTPHVTFSMPAHRFFPGDPASLTAQIWNPSNDTIRNAPFFVILEYLDAYYFMPGGDGISFYTLDFPTGTSELAILPEFSWPDIPHSLDQALWYGAILDVGMTQMVSNVCVYDFDWRQQRAD